MFRLISHSRHWKLWMYVLVAFAGILALTIYKADTSLSFFNKFWCGVCFVVLFLFVDWVGEIVLRQMFRRVYGLIVRDSNQGYIDLALGRLATLLQQSIEEEEALASQPIDRFARQAAQQKTKFAKRTFWRTHWLAGLFEYRMKPSWKEYILA